MMIFYSVFLIHPFLPSLFLFQPCFHNNHHHQKINVNNSSRTSISMALNVLERSQRSRAKQQAIKDREEKRKQQKQDWWNTNHQRESNIMDSYDTKTSAASLYLLPFLSNGLFNQSMGHQPYLQLCSCEACIK